MSAKNFTLTEEQAINRMERRSFIDEPCTKSNIGITNIALKRADGSPFVWENSGERFAVAYLSAMSPYHMQQAQADLDAGNTVEATNHQFAVRIPYDVAMPLVNPDTGRVSALATASVAFENYTNKDGIEVLSAVKASIDAIVASKKKVTFSKAVVPIQVEN